MKQIEYSDISDIAYNRIVESINKMIKEQFRFLNIVDDVTNQIFIDLFKASMPGIADEAFQESIDAATPKAVENTFKYYQKISFSYCFSKTKQPELSEDISQEAIMAMLKSKNKINNINAWLFQVTNNLLCKYYESQKQERELFEMLRNNAAVIQQLDAHDDSFDIVNLSDSDKEAIIASEEFQEYEKMISFKSLKEFAESMDVSEKVAQKRKEKIIRDLKSKTKVAMGWQVSRSILNYNQYNAIQKFIRELLSMENIARYVKSDEELSLKVQSIMQGINEIHDWKIIMQDSKTFRLTVFSLDESIGPRAVTFTLFLNHRNSVLIKDFKENEFVAAHKLPKNFRIPRQMGMSMLSYEDILAMLKQDE